MSASEGGAFAFVCTVLRHSSPARAAALARARAGPPTAPSRLRRSGELQDFPRTARGRHATRVASPPASPVSSVRPSNPRQQTRRDAAKMSLAVPTAPNSGLFKPGYQKYAPPPPPTNHLLLHARLTLVPATTPKMAPSCATSTPAAPSPAPSRPPSVPTAATKSSSTTCRK